MELRCFVSAELPAELKARLGETLKPLRATPADVKWVLPENLHITLKFLGRTKEELIPDIKAALTQAASAHSPTMFKLSGAGAFPNMRAPRVIWLGMAGAEGLSSLKSDVEAALIPLGYEPEGRKFSPHLTIGRVRSKRGNIALRGEIEALSETVFGEVRVAGICLMKSVLSPGGARYTILHEITL